MEISGQLVDAAIEQAEVRFPTGYAGAGALQLDTGEIITSVFFDSENDATHLCHEAGAICEAYRRDGRVVASVCVSRESENDPFTILTACGVCQERLFTWGKKVCVAVPHPDDPTKWISRTLEELQPYYWKSILDEGA